MAEEQQHVPPNQDTRRTAGNRNAGKRHETIKIDKSDCRSPLSVYSNLNTYGAHTGDAFLQNNMGFVDAVSNAQDATAIDQALQDILDAAHRDGNGWGAGATMVNSLLEMVCQSRYLIDVSFRAT